MKLRLCYYGELDPFTGIADEGPGSLDAVIADLTLLCLLYDAVIVPPENLLAHPLALPAFEALAPLVRAGRLGTSGAPSSPGLHAFIADTAALYREARTGRSRAAAEPPGPRSSGARRQRDIDESVARWCALLPEGWPFLRDVPGQIAGFTDRIRRFCEAPELGESSRKKTLRLIDGHAQAGLSGVERPELMAHVAALRGEAPARDIDMLRLACQAAYFTMGSEGHRPGAASGVDQVCTLYPGRFARFVQQNAALVASDTTPPYDWQVAPAHLAGRMETVGLSPERIRRIGASAVLEIAASAEWRGLRSFLTAPAPDDEMEHAAREGLAGAGHELRAALAGEGRRVSSRARRYPLLPERWQLASQAALGARLGGAGGGGPVVDLDALVLRDGAQETQITRCRADLVSLLVVRASAGVSAHDVKQLTLESDLLDGVETARLVPSTWRAQARESKALDEARTARIDRLKTRTNLALGGIGFEIACDRGRSLWRLADQRGCDRRLGIDGDASATARGSPAPPAEPPGLTKQQARLWRVLSTAHPGYVSLHTLAAALDKPLSAYGLHQATDAMYKLDGALERLGAPWRVARLQRGVYGLAPSGARSEVG